MKLTKKNYTLSIPVRLGDGQFYSLVKENISIRDQVFTPEVSYTAEGAGIDYKKGSYLEYKPSRKTLFPAVHAAASRSDKSTVLKAEIRISRTIYIIWGAVAVLFFMILFLIAPAGAFSPAAVILPYVIWLVIAALSVAVPVSVFRKDASSAVQSLKEILTTYFKKHGNEQAKEQDTHLV